MATHVQDGVYVCICHESRRDERRSRGRPEKCLHNLYTADSSIAPPRTVKRGRPPLPLPTREDMQKLPSFNAAAPKLGRPRKTYQKQHLSSVSCKRIFHDETSSEEESRTSEEDDPTVMTPPSTPEIIDLTEEQQPYSPPSPDIVAASPRTIKLRKEMLKVVESLNESLEQEATAALLQSPVYYSDASPSSFSPIILSDEPLSENMPRDVSIEIRFLPQNTPLDTSVGIEPFSPNTLRDLNIQDHLPSLLSCEPSLNVAATSSETSTSNIFSPPSSPDIQTSPPTIQNTAYDPMPSLHSPLPHHHEASAHTSSNIFSPEMPTSPFTVRNRTIVHDIIDIVESDDESQMEDELNLPSTPCFENIFSV